MFLLSWIYLLKITLFWVALTLVVGIKRMLLLDFIDVYFLSINFIFQVSYSVVDTRPKNKMAALCKEKNVKILAYGTLMVMLTTILRSPCHFIFSNSSFYEESFDCNFTIVFYFFDIFIFLIFLRTIKVLQRPILLFSTL